MSRPRPCLTALAAAGAACLASALAAAPPPLRSVVAEAKPLGAGADLVFVVGGDSRPTGRGAPLPHLVPAIFGEVALIRPDFVVWTGDSVYGYCETGAELHAEHAAFVAAASLAGVPVFNTTGNHEIHTLQSCDDRPRETLCAGDCALAQFRGLYGWEYGSFDNAGAHFILLSTDELGQEDRIAGEQLDWLKHDLETHQDARAIFVFTHTEFFSSPQIDNDQLHGHEPLADVPALHALFRRYPVKAVFSGHEHLYWHEAHDGIDYFVAGGGGAPLYASPDRGGFSSYVVVGVRGKDVTYDVLEAGRLFVEPAKGGDDETKLWVANSNDSDLPLRGITATLPPRADCKNLAVSADVPYRARTAPKFTVTECANGRVRLATESFARRRSALLTVKAGTPAKPAGR